MPSERPKRHRTLKRMDRAPDPDLSDHDVIAALVADASERDLAALSRDFPRDSHFALAIYEQFLARGSTWSESLRARLADTLARCRLHDEADVVRDA